MTGVKMIRVPRQELDAMRYAVVVEAWKHVMPMGGKRRIWLAEFKTGLERNRAAKWYKRFYDWHLVSGTPESFLIQSETINWLKTRLIPFFGCL